MKTNVEEWVDRNLRNLNDPERIKARKSLPVAYTVPRHRKKFTADLTIRNSVGTLKVVHFNADTLEDLKHQIGQVQFLSLDGEVEARQKQWRIDNGIKAPKQS